MLGKLAKRLRILGFDVLYDRTLNDNEIIRLSHEQDRVILTRDTALAARPLAANHLFITHDHAQEQADQFFAAFPFTTHPDPLTRCSKCNCLLAPIEKKEAQDFVPHYVYERMDSFVRCPACKRTYWQGTHVRRMAIPERMQKK